MTNLLTNSDLDIFVPAASLEAARIEALRVCWKYLNWRKCLACKIEDVVFAGQPIRLEE